MDDYVPYAEFGQLRSGQHDPEAERTLSVIQNKIAAGHSQEDVLNFVFDSLNEFLPFDRVGVALLDKGNLRSVWVKSRTPTKYLIAGYSAPVAGSSLEVLLKTRRPRVIPDLLAYLKAHPKSESTILIVKDGMRSSLTFPLELRGEPLGVVFFSSTKTEVFTAAHLRLLESVAQGLSLVIEHTQLLEAKEEVKSHDRMLANVLHDIRSPLGVIMAFTDLLSETPEFSLASDKVKSMFSIVKRNNEVLLGLVTSLGEFLESRRAEFQIHRQNVTLPDYIIGTQESLKSLGQQKEIELKVCPPEAPIKECFFDPIRIHQVLQNLVSNAVKFSQPRTHINIRSWLKGSRLFFSVQDEGPGIPAGEVPKLFREFSVTSIKPTSGEKSSGLGLAICKQIIESHGGEISVDTAPGQGSTFQFWIPVRMSS